METQSLDWKLAALLTKNKNTLSFASQRIFSSVIQKLCHSQAVDKTEQND
jgi:hypothetical protein